jgi:predicted dehydrogenase
VCDLDETRLAHVKTLYPECKTSSRSADLLASDIEAVIIATPASTHYQLVMEALHAGKHVFVEKPLAMTTADAETIVREAQRLNRIVMVGHICEYNPAVEAIRDLIASGELGQIYFLNGIRTSIGRQHPDVDVIWDLAVHDVAILRFILGQAPRAVQAQGGVYINRQSDLHDVAYLTYYFAGDLAAHLRVSWMDPYRIRRYTIVGSKKMLVFDDAQPIHKLLLVSPGVELPSHASLEEAALRYNRDKVQPYPVPQVEPLEAECQHFLDCVRTGRMPRSNGAVGLSVVHLLEAAHASLHEDGKKKELL